MKSKHYLLSLAVASLAVSLLVGQGTSAQEDGRGAGTRPSIPDRKVALVIGNSDYDVTVGTLRNPANDAADVASALKRLGFGLVGGRAHLNLNKRKMLELIREFGGRIREGGVGVFYFAGHGVQVDKKNYLIPITDSLRFQEDAESEAVEVDQVLREMEYAENALNILILDACRNNNLPRRTREARSGLREPQRRPSGTLIAFAARDGQTALENPEGRNGLYTQELLKNLETPNLRLEDIFINTRRGVKKLSGKRQEPVEYGSLDDIYYLKVDESVAAAQPPPRPTPDVRSGRVKFDLTHKDEGAFIKRRIGEKDFEFLTMWSAYNNSSVYLYIFNLKTLSKIPRETILRDATAAAKFPHTKYRAEILSVGDKAVVSNQSGKYAVIQVIDVKYSNSSKEVEFAYEILPD